MSSSIYNHKHLQPTGASTQGPSQQQHSQARLNDCFDTIRQEFEILAQEVNHSRGQRDDLDNKGSVNIFSSFRHLDVLISPLTRSSIYLVARIGSRLTGQVNELNIIRQSLYDLETQHGKIRDQYEAEIRALRSELHALRSQGREREVLGLASLGRDRPDALRPDPAIRGEPPMRGEPPVGRDRDRERELLRERELQRDVPRERDRDRDIIMAPGPGIIGRGEGMGRDALGLGRPQAVGGPGAGPPGEAVLSALPLTPVGLSAGAPGQGSGGAGGYDSFYGRGDRDRDRERMGDRGGMSDRDRVMDRERERPDRDGRDVKRIKTERMKSDRGGKLVSFASSFFFSSASRVHTHVVPAPCCIALPASVPADPFSPGMSHPSAHHAHHQSISIGPPAPGSGAGPSPSNPNALNSSTSLSTPTLGPSSSALPGQSGPGQGLNGSLGMNGGGPNANMNGNGNSGGQNGMSVGTNPSAPNASVNVTPKLPPAPGTGTIALGLPPPPVPYTGSGQGQGQEGPGVNGGGNPPYPHTPTPSTALPPTAPSLPPSHPSNQPSAGTGAEPMQVDLSLDPHTVPPELKKEGPDWFAVFSPLTNPNGTKDGGPGGANGGKKRALDVTLQHTLMHESVLVDEGASKTGDLYIRSVCFSPDGKLLATGAEDKLIRIWDIAKKRIRQVFDGHQQEIYSLDFSRDGRLIVSGSGDKTARIWDMTDGKPNKILSINEDTSDAGVTSVCISPDGRLVAAGSLDTIVRIWDVATGQLVERLKGHRDSVYSVAFTPDGKGLVSGSLDKTLKYWDLRPILRNRDGPGSIAQGNSTAAKNGVKDGGEKGSQCTMNFTGHKDYVLSVAVSHDGQWVVSGSKDRGVQFWDAKTAVAHCMLQGHKNSVISIDLSPAGSILATGSGDWQARIWSYTTL
ncbi:uncharacterized protein FIBRA_00759 [Fibroporia radiculosa]|uniref:Transcriptional repressor Tup1 N-terminal domain-containing protein n=1 Tax=Fibroporia radiculosa TaxID=599839 RepID=J4H0M8_9APHY|nr:uncharacterized protein FIBRA_00759 [Fibroporia radiculosa]CCL98754.1 predicted protein [Fibroporia radiculosa]